MKQRVRAPVAPESEPHIARKTKDKQDDKRHLKVIPHSWPAVC